MHLAERVVQHLRQDETVFEIVAPPQWALVVFRLRAPEGSSRTADLDALNRRFWEQLSARASRFALTQTVLPEVGFCIRLAVGSPQTEQRHIDDTFAEIKACALATIDA